MSFSPFRIYIPIVNHNKNALCWSLALIETISPDLEKQGFFAVVFVNREFSEEQESIFPKMPNLLLLNKNKVKEFQHFIIALHFLKKAISDYEMAFEYFIN